MSKFRVGDRVRVATERFTGQHHLIGRITRATPVPKDVNSLNLSVAFEGPTERSGPSNSYHDSDLEHYPTPPDYDVMLKDAGEYYAAVTEGVVDA